ncbi:MAG TPA: HigA family addiction module antitoxin [Terriglobia bacterium]
MTATELLAEFQPGRTLRDDVLQPLGMSVNALAKDLHVPATRLNDIVRGRRGITADTALRLGRYLGTTAQFWLNLQSIYNLRLAENSNGRVIRRQVSPRRAA